MYSSDACPPLRTVGSGTGVAGIALAHLGKVATCHSHFGPHCQPLWLLADAGAASVVISDKDSQIPLMEKNIALNQPQCASVVALPLCWSTTWQQESPALAKPGSFDLLVCCDCVYPDRPSDLPHVLLELMELNPSATLLLSCEQRPAPASAPRGTDHIRDFCDAMRRSCQVERVPDDELDPRWACDDITLWRMRLASPAA